MKRVIRSAEERDWFVVDTPIPDCDPDAEKKRISRELEDEADAYDLEHGEGIYAAVFDESKTGMSYYDNFLNEKDLKYMQDAKNLTGEIVEMTPQQYFEEAADVIFEGRHTAEELKEQREASSGQDGYEGRLVDQYADMMKNGETFPLCMLNYADLGQEGLHRMYAAGEAFGWDTPFPVLVVNVYDQERWNKMKEQEAIRDYQRYTFERVVQEAVDRVSDWNSPVPDNICDQMEYQVEEAAKRDEDDPHIIEVDCEIPEDDSNCLNVWLISLDGIHVDTATNPKQCWLDDMFATSDGEDDDIDIDNELEIDDSIWED